MSNWNAGFNAGGFLNTVNSRIQSLEKKIAAGGAQPVAGPLAVGAAPPNGGRTVYVLHSGMRDPDNEAALSLKAALKKRGIKDADIVVMPAVYPNMDLSPTSRNFGSGVQDNIRIFNQSADKKSDLVKKQYKAYQDALTKAGVKAGDKIVWVGDSAGGQMGFTLARMAKDNNGFQMDTIITLGSPIAKNEVPPEVKIRHYTSNADQIQHGKLLGGQVGKPIPDNLDANDKIRWFRNIGHCDWYKDTDPAIVDKIISESKPDKPRTNLQLAALPLPGAPFAGLMMEGIESRNSYERNRGVDVPDNATKVQILGTKVDVLTQLDGLGQWLKRQKPSTGLGK